MHAVFLAPLLSATSSTVVVWIILDLRRLRDHFGDAPALLLRHRARLGNPDLVARLALLLLVVRLVLLLLGHELAVLAMLHAALHLDHHRLRHLVGEDDPDAGLRAATLGLRLRVRRVLGHGYSFFSAAGAASALGAGFAGAAEWRCALELPCFCVSTVRTRARSRLFLVTSAVESSVPARRRIFRLKRFSRISPARRESSSWDRSFS